MSSKLTIAIMVPVTSRKADYKSIDDIEIFKIFLPSFIKSLTGADTNRFKYWFYLGYDEGDRFYDNEQNVNEIKSKFSKMVNSESIILKEIKRCRDTMNCPAYVWNILFKDAFDDGCDYFYQMGDDILLLTPGWSERFVDVLKNNNGIGVTGPLEKHNQAYMTQTFVSREHRKIFGSYFLSSIKNWCCDYWIHHVYMPEHALWQKDIMVLNTSVYTTNERYEVAPILQKEIENAISESRPLLSEWLLYNREGGGNYKCIDIVVLSHERTAMITEMLIKLKERTRYPHRIIVCDNKSSSVARDNLKRLKSEGYIHKLIFNDFNKWPEGFNPGLKEVNGNLYCLSDPDIIVPELGEKCWLTRLVEVMDEYHFIGKLGLHISLENYCKNQGFLMGSKERYINTFESEYIENTDNKIFKAPVNTGMAIYRRSLFKTYNGRYPEVPCREYQNMYKECYEIGRTSPPLSCIHLGLNECMDIGMVNLEYVTVRSKIIPSKYNRKLCWLLKYKRFKKRIGLFGKELLNRQSAE
ncbi:MAG: glycosyltransferase [Elusimicrobiota bacterium]